MATDQAYPSQPANGSPSARYLVEQNQEDIDLIVSWGREIVLVEAKAYSPFTNKQWKSKLVRLDLLHDFYCSLAPSADKAIRLHFVLASPAQPQGLKGDWL